VRAGQAWGVREKKSSLPQKKPTCAEERKKKGQLEFTTLVSQGMGRDEKVHP